MGTSTSTLSVISKLYEYMARFGLPHTIVSDNGTQFTSAEFRSFSISNGISHVTSPAYHPASNGQAESYVKVVKKGIKSCLLSGHNNKTINHKLCKYLFDYRNSIHSTTGCSPAQLVFGHKLRSRFDLINPIPPPPASVTLAQLVENKQCSQSKELDNRRTYKHFKAGDYILYKKHNVNKQYSWKKGVIVKRIGKVIYIVKDSITSHTIKKHQNQILPYKGTGRNPQHKVDCPIEFEDVSSQQTSPQCPRPTVDKSTSVEGGEGGQETEDRTSLSERSTEDEEFYEASEITDENENVQEGSSPQQQAQTERQPSAGKILRPVPRVDYKKFY